MIMYADDIIYLIKRCKKNKNLTWKSISEYINKHEVFVTSALLGQNTLSNEEALKICDLLELSDTANCLFKIEESEAKKQIIDFLCTPSLKGSLESDVVSDPLVYRFHEITQVYGTTIKEIIHEKFGDGIMSAIDFTLDISKKEDEKGDRVVITYNGKFLPYKKW